MLRSFVIAFLMSGGLAAAVPTRIEGRSISSSLLSTFNLMEQYAAAAYCSDNNDSSGTEISCGDADNCPLVESATTKSVSEFENSLITDVTGFVATDSTNKLIVVSFRGSTSIRNWVTDFTFDTVTSDICSGCTVHQGFWTSWTEARSTILSSVKSTATSYPSYKIVVTGHSLGGAIASLCAAELRKAGYTAALYTFGAPRIAGETLSNFISNQSGGNYRVTHYNDIVPRLPPISFGFVHISPEYYIDKPNFQTVSASDISTCSGSVNYNCNTAWILTDIIAHTWYFNSIAACYDQFLEFKLRF